jgi:enterochelin esterase-like enzyme
MKLMMRLQCLLFFIFLFGAPFSVKADNAWNGCINLPALAGDNDWAFYQIRSGISHGTLENVAYSNYLGASKRMRIYLPPDYATSGLYYPVLYLSHGKDGNETNWTDWLRAHTILDNLIADGKAVPMIVVMPKWDGENFGLSLGIEPEALGKPDVITQELTKDIIPYVENHYRVKSNNWNRAIAGVSLGGFPTLNGGLRRLDLFSEIIAYAPFSNEYHLANVEQNYQPILTDATANKMLALPIFTSIGESDENTFLVTAAQGWDVLMSKYNINHFVQWTTGGHEEMNWRRYLHQTAQVLFAPCTQNQSSAFIKLGSGGAASFNTGGEDQSSVLSGYAKLTKNSGLTPYGTAVFKLKQNGAIVSEAGVPASPPTTLARIFIDYRTGVTGVPGRADSGKVDVNTGFAIVNNGYNAATITYTLRNTEGAPIGSVQNTLPAGMHTAMFFNQLCGIAPGIVPPTGFAFGSLDIASDQLLSVTALRMTTNQRGEQLYTTTPVVDMNQVLTSEPVYFPQFADGGGWTTYITLLNSSGDREKGLLEFFDNSGNLLVFTPVGGTAIYSIPYDIPASGIYRMRSNGSATDAKVGWVRVTPNSGNSTPAGSGVFCYNPVNVLTTESGIPSVRSTTHARIFIDLTENHNTGLAIVNVNTVKASIAIQAFQMDGVTPAGTSRGPLQLMALGHDAEFADQFISGLPDDFMGVLDISASTPFAPLTTRSLYNEREDYLITTFPVADAARTAPSPVIFPHIGDGGGYLTQFILLNPTGSSDASLFLYDEKARPFATELKTN